jgi:GT2 family glycosyltransferase
VVGLVYTEWACFDRLVLFDEDFFAYYEDIDLSFRARLARWKVRYEPKSIAYHQIGATSSKISGFTTYQTVKNLPLLFFKNVPRRYLFKVGWRFYIAYSLFIIRAITRGQIWPVIKGCLKVAYLSIRVLRKRIHIQRSKQVSDKYIWEMLTHDLPPNAHALRTLRTKWRHVRKKKT